jgi:hypothetical protein
MKKRIIFLGMLAISVNILAGNYSVYVTNETKDPYFVALAGGPLTRWGFLFYQTPIITRVMGRTLVSELKSPNPYIAPLPLQYDPSYSICEVVVAKDKTGEEVATCVDPKISCEVDHPTPLPLPATLQFTIQESRDHQVMCLSNMNASR